MCSIYVLWLLIITTEICIVGAFSPAVISASNANSNPVEDPLQLVKFLKQLMELSQKKHTGSGIVELVQRLIVSIALQILQFYCSKL